MTVTHNSWESFSKILRFAAATVLLGRAWQHFILESTYRTLLWDERLMAGLVQSWLSMTWMDYANSPAVNSFITAVNFGAGIFLLGNAALLVGWDFLPKKKIFSVLVALAGCQLIFLGWIDFRNSQGQVGMLIEHAGQFLSPHLFLAATYVSAPKRSWVLELLRWAIVLTFVGHGLYAFGYYPVPGSFIDMSIWILKLTETQARLFLKIAGVLDFALAAGVVFLGRRRTEPGLLVGLLLSLLAYGVVWGGVTALARVLANLSPQSWWHSLEQWLPEVVLRLPHMLLPGAMLWIVIWSRSRERHLADFPRA